MGAAMLASSPLQLPAALLSPGVAAHTVHMLVAAESWACTVQANMALAWGAFNSCERYELVHTLFDPTQCGCWPLTVCERILAHAAGQVRSWGPQWGILKQKCNLREIRLSHSGLLFIRREAAF